jgi:hypothetical protein
MVKEIAIRRHDQAGRRLGRAWRLSIRNDRKKRNHEPIGGSALRACGIVAYREITFLIAVNQPIPFSI